MTKAQWEELCVTVAKFGKRIMVERQNGTPMILQMKALGDDKNMWSGLLKAAVKDAYEVPRYSSQKMKSETAQDFEDKVFADCLKASDKR